MESRHQVPTRAFSRPLIAAIVGYTAFCALSVVSRFIPAVFLLVVVSGIAFPLLWARLTRDGAAIGLTRRNLGPALMWGVVAGVAGTVTIFLGAQREPYPEPFMPGLQIAVGIPIWLLIMSPFQEFFFRGWLQPRFDRALGPWTGIVVTTVCFTVWHFLSPFQGAQGSWLDIASVSTVLTMSGMGVGFGYIFQRTGSIVAPWLAHALMGIALVAVGGMTFIQYT